MLLVFFPLSSTLVIFSLSFFLRDVPCSADVLKANPSNLGAQITRVSFFLLVSIAVNFFVCPPTLWLW